MMVLTVIIEYVHLGLRDKFSKDAHVTFVECPNGWEKLDISWENKNHWSVELCWSSGVLVVMPHGPPDQQEFEARVGVSYWLANRLASGLHSRFSKGLRFQFFRLPSQNMTESTGSTCVDSPVPLSHVVQVQHMQGYMWCRCSTCKDTCAC